MQRKFTIITSQALSLVNFRGPLILALTKLGMRVYALAPDFDDDTRRKVMALGAEPVDISLSRAGRNPLGELLDFWKLTKQLRRLDDTSLFKACGIVIERQIVRIDGIGLNLDHYVPPPPVLTPITFIMVARMLWEKGVLDYIEAIRVVRKRHQGYLNPTLIRQMWLEHLGGQQIWQYHLWDVLMFQAWLSHAR
jgi:glycosyltransferase involved in cell wall biosynthesis